MNQESSFGQLRPADAVLSELDAVGEFCCRNGAEIQPGSRLGKYTSALRRNPSWIGEVDSNVGTSLELQAHIEIGQFATIARCLDERFTDPELQSKLKTALKDASIPSDPARPSPGRDYQFELFLAAVFQAAGLNPRFREPDVVLTVEGLNVGIAAKRLKSAQKARTRLSEGASQCARSKAEGVSERGLMAVDCSYLIRTSGGLARVDSLDACRSHHHSRLSLVGKNIARRAEQSKAFGGACSGILLYGSGLGLIGPESTLTRQSVVQSISTEPNDRHLIVAIRAATSRVFHSS